jgi:hypothetical protein
MSDLDREGGRASAEELARRIASAPLPYLQATLENPALGPAHVLLCLKNPAADGPFIHRLTRNPDWMKSEEIRLALVLHPRTPRLLAMNLVGRLWWRDLARVSGATGIAPGLRRAAERLLGLRLQEMAVGERIALARLAGRGVIAALLGDPDPAVIRTLLVNPRFIEEDALRIATGLDTPGAVLAALAESARWACRPPLRKAIARHPAAPAPAALRAVQGLGAAALHELLQTPHLPTLVRVAAARLIEARRATHAPSAAAP